MATLADAKVVYGSAATAGGFSNEEKWIQVDYNFSNDTGAQADYIALTAGAAFLVRDFYVTCSTSCVGATANLDLGLGAGGVELWSDKDGPAIVETAGSNIFLADAVFLPIIVPAAGTIQLGIETADLTAGVFTMNFLVKKI